MLLRYDGAVAAATPPLIFAAAFDDALMLLIDIAATLMLSFSPLA